MEDVRRICFVRIAPFLPFTNPHPQDVMWPMIMGYSAALLKAEGLQVHILDSWAEPCSREILLEKIRKSKPDLLVLETDTPTLDLTKELARDVKMEMEIPIWACGQHASVLPHSFYELQNGEPVFQGSLVGEYDAVIRALVDGYRTQTLPQDTTGILFFRDKEATDENASPLPAQYKQLDSLPRLSYDLFSLAHYRIYSSQVPTFRPLRWGFCLTTRGCPYKCIYCSPTLRQSFGRAYRQQCAERVVEDMEDQKNSIGVNAIFMEDDIFNLDRERTQDICERLYRKRRPVPFVIQTRLDTLDRETISWLRRAGCIGITASIESGSDRILKVLEKETTREKMLKASGEINRQGIPLTAYYIVGSPTETLEEMEETLSFAKQVNALMIQVAFLTPYPGSKIYQQLAPRQRRALLTLSHYNVLAVNLSSVNDETLLAFQKSFYRRYYFSPRNIWNYLRKRFLYAAINNREISLIWHTLRFLLHGDAGQAETCGMSTKTIRSSS